jgi:hypothetical protein
MDPRPQGGVADGQANGRACPKGKVKALRTRTTCALGGIERMRATDHPTSKAASTPGSPAKVPRGYWPLGKLLPS